MAQAHGNILAGMQRDAESVRCSKCGGEHTVSGHTPGPKAEAHGCWHTWYTRPATCCDLWEVYVALHAAEERATQADNAYADLHELEAIQAAEVERLQRANNDLRQAAEGTKNWLIAEFGVGHPAYRFVESLEAALADGRP